MKRQRIKKPSGNPTAILTADIELRMHAPLCRTDEDYFQSLKDKIKWLKELQEKYQCPIFDGGDLFDKRYKQQPSHALLDYAIENLPHPFYTVPGNHDLPGKTISNYYNSAMAVLESAGVISVPQEYVEFSKDIGVYGFPWGVEIKQPTVFQDYNVALVHAMVYDGNPPFPGCTGYEKNDLLKLLPDFDLIVCGHNHQSFIGRRGKTLLVNPGSLMRNDADQIDYKPRVFLWYAEENEVIPVPVPIKPGVVSREHLDFVADKENRLSAFVETLGTQESAGINFEENLEEMSSGLNIKIQDKVWDYYERDRKKDK